MVHEIKDWMSEMPIEQTVGAGASPTHEEQGALREKLGDIRLDSDQVYLNAIQIMGLFTSVSKPLSLHIALCSFFYNRENIWLICVAAKVT